LLEPRAGSPNPSFEFSSENWLGKVSGPDLVTTNWPLK